MLKVRCRTRADATYAISCTAGWTTAAALVNINLAVAASGTSPATQLALAFVSGFSAVVLGLLVFTFSSTGWPVALPYVRTLVIPYGCITSFLSRIPQPVQATWLVLRQLGGCSDSSQISYDVTLPNLLHENCTPRMQVAALCWALRAIQSELRSPDLIKSAKAYMEIGEVGRVAITMATAGDAYALALGSLVVFLLQMAGISH